MPHQRTMPGAVVLGSDFKALGVVRSLGRRGIPCIVIDNHPRSAWFSRYVGQRLRWHGPMEGQAFLSFLLSAGKKLHLEGWLLIPAQDEAVELVARNTTQLANIYQLVTQAWDVIQWALDKRLTYQMAQEVGVAYPRTWYPANEDELATLGISFPAIIKPAISTHLQYATRLKALPAQTLEELRTHYHFAATILCPAEIMVQEVIPGPGATQFSVAAYCKEGESILSMSARRTRQYPIDYGLGSSFVEAIEIPALFAPAEQLLRFMGVTGMVEVEFKHDLRDNQYKLLDINVRPWGWHTLCIACGLDFPAIQYRDSQGYAPVPIKPHYDHHWIRCLTDVPAGWQEIRAGITRPQAYLRSLLGKTVFSVFAWHDPLPALGDGVIALSRIMQGVFRRRGGGR
ncbi:MAG: ATP-grasp domain-containing protein [Ktedonobacteraceae bacterium]